MNKHRILELADYLEELPDGSFDMSMHHYFDGTPQCLAGWTVSLFSPGELPYYDAEALKARAGDFLELPNYMVDALFTPNTRHATMNAEPGWKRYIDPARAAQTLRHLAETEKVEWKRIDR